MFQAETHFYLGLRYRLFQNRCKVGKGPYTIHLAQSPSYRKMVTHSAYSAELENLWIIALYMTLYKYVVLFCIEIQLYVCI
jgi:hypothetical protein